MTHTYHNAAENYDERQILFDECPECAARGQDVQLALKQMDSQTFTRAWDRSKILFEHGESPQTGPISEAELGVLRVLGLVRARCEHTGLVT